MSQPRHKRKHTLLAHNGRQVHVTRQLDSGDVIEYDAILDLEVDAQGHVGRALLERIKYLYAFAHLGAYELFLATNDLPIKGFPDWFKISNHYVVLNRHTQGRTYTRMTMDAMGYSPGI